MRLAILLGVAVALLSGCSEPRTCIRSHKEEWLMPMTTGDVTVMIPMEDEVCDEYEAVKPNAEAK